MQVMHEQFRSGITPSPVIAQNDADAVIRLSKSAAREPAGHQDVSAITCFTPGTRLATQTGLKPVETIAIGDRILTRDCGFQSVRWVGHRTVACANLRSTSRALPILIRADALGPGCPERDMIVSPRHRILTTDIKHLDMTGETEALIEAAALVGQPGVMCVLPHELTYVHVLFDHHEVILSDNLWSESFQLNQPAITALRKDQSSVVAQIFPRIAQMTDAYLQDPARLCLTREDIALRCA